LTPESILKSHYAHRDQRPSVYKTAQCRVCLIKETDPIPPVLVNDPEKVYELVREELITADRETLISLMLDTKMYLIGIQTVAVGKINTCGANPADIFKSALLANAPSIVLAHNHPSGDLKPSSEDIAFTRNLIKAGKILRVQVLDHLIISSKGYASLNQLGLMGIVKTF